MTDGSDRLHNNQLNTFLGELDEKIDKYRQNYGIDDEEFSITSMGGTICVPYNTDQDVSQRRVNDLDFAVQHSDHYNSNKAYLEARALEDALNELGFEFTQATVNGYDPAEEDCQTLTNVDPSKNNLPISNIDLLGGDSPLGKYPQEWINDYSEPIADNIGALDTEGTTVRKLFRATVDRQGPEDDSQDFDLGVLVGYFRAKPEEFNEDRAEEAWDELLEANEDKAKPWSEARGYLLNC